MRWEVTVLKVVKHQRNPGFYSPETEHFAPEKRWLRLPSFWNKGPFLFLGDRIKFWGCNFPVLVSQESASYKETAWPMSNLTRTLPMQVSPDPSHQSACFFSMRQHARKRRCVFFLSDIGSNLPTTHMALKRNWSCNLIVMPKLVCWESNLRHEDSPKLADAFLFVCWLLVWYSYPNLVDLDGTCRQIYHTSYMHPMGNLWHLGIPSSMIHGTIS